MDLSAFLFVQVWIMMVIFKFNNHMFVFPGLTYIFVLIRTGKQQNIQYWYFILNVQRMRLL